MAKITKGGKKEELQFLATAGMASTTAWDAETGNRLGHAVSVDVYKDEDDNRYLVASGCSMRYQTPLKLSEQQYEQYMDFTPYESGAELAWAFRLMGFTSCFNQNEDYNDDFLTFQ